MFAKQEDGTLGLKESRLFDHFYHKSNIYHLYPSTTIYPLKDQPRQLKVYLFDNQLTSQTKLKIISDSNERYDVASSKDFYFAILNPANITELVNSVLKQSLNIQTLKELVSTFKFKDLRVTLDSSLNENSILETWLSTQRSYEKIAMLRDFVSVLDILQVNLLANKDKKIYKDQLDVYEVTQSVFDLMTAD